MVEIDNILDVEKFLDGIDAVIFDLDDTLYSEKEYVRSGYREIAKLISEVTEEELWKAFLNKEPAIDVVLERHGLMNRKEEALHAYRHQQPYIHLYNGVNEIELIVIDIQSWCHNVLSIFFGRGYHFMEYANVIASATINYSGNHSTLFDILARYGLLGIGLYVGILHNVRKKLMSSCVSERARVFLVVIWVFILVNMVLNDIGFNHIIFLLLIMTDYLLTKENYASEPKVKEAIA